MSQKTKNKILFGFICVLTIFILFIAIKINSNRINNLSNVSYIGNYLQEIKYKDLDNFIVENPDVVIYVSNSSDNDSISFEKRLVKVIRKYNLENNIYFINITDTNIVDPIYENDLELVFYSDFKMSEIVDCNTLDTQNKLITALKERGLVND